MCGQVVFIKNKYKLLIPETLIETNKLTLSVHKLPLNYNSAYGINVF